jgi:hypothetical protein
VKLGVESRAAAGTTESTRPAAARVGKTPVGRRTPRVRHALKREERHAASHAALGQQARRGAHRQSTGAR